MITCYEGRNNNMILSVCVCARSSVIQREDPEGKIGVKIGKELMTTASDALKANVTRLAPLVLPVSEQLIFAGNFFARKASTLCPSASQDAYLSHQTWALCTSQ